MRRLLAVTAHPNDESMSTGGLILRHTRAGIETHVICATQGELGRKKTQPDPELDLATIRANELEAAAEALALSGVELWDYPDGGLSAVNHVELTQRIWEEMKRLRPAAVVSWGPDGGYGHPDRIAIGACTDTAVAGMPEGERPGLYHVALDEDLAAFHRMMGRLSEGDGTDLPMVVADRVDLVMDLSPEEVMMKLRAIDCHPSQLEEWRVEIRNHPDHLMRAYGHEPYVAVASKAPALTAAGLLGEFA
jgi:N-acetyl-1-D-myo-inositol-2-amino-2-deoxy-alpha-D-glucopyranoside deacetylase